MAIFRPAGVTHHEPELTEPGLVLYSGADGVTRLVDRAGTVRRSWPYAGLPARLLDPATTGGRRGDVVVQLSGNDDPRGGIYGNRTIGRLSWEGEVVWSWGEQAPGGSARQNHDWELLPGGNILLLVTLPRPVPGLGAAPVGDQGLYEVTPGGEIVWQWRAGDHLDELGLSEQGRAELARTAAHDPDDSWGFLELNSARTVGPNRWFRADPTSVFRPENILISSRKANVVALIDRTDGRIAWRLGPYFPDRPGGQHERINRHRVPRPLDQISGQHNPHVIADGLPGAGNVLLFDNQGGAGYPPAPLGIYAGSRVLEVDPLTREIVWQYTAEDSGLPSWTFFSSFVSNAERLPGGNTLVVEGMTGRIFEVTSAGRVVWEYHSPHVGPAVNGEPDVTEPQHPDVGRPVTTPLIYRVQYVPAHWVPDDAGTGS